MTQAIDTKYGRYYPWTGNKYVSVTTAISEGIPKPGLNRWFIKNIADIAASHRKKIAAMTKARSKDWILDKHYGDRDQSAANLGSTVHAICDRIAKGEIDYIVGNPNGDVTPYVDGFLKFIEDHKPEFLETEVTVYSRKHGFAGTADMFVKIGDKTYVVDIKTGKSVWPEAALQIAAYRHADFIGSADGRENPVPTCSGGFVLHLRPEGYKVIPVSCGLDVFDTFLSALDIFRWNNIDGTAAIGEPWHQN